MDGHSTSWITRETQINTPTIDHCTFIRMAKIQNAEQTTCWQRCGKAETIFSYWEYKIVLPFWKTILQQF